MNTQNVVTGMMSALLACTGGAILLVQSAERMELSRVELVSWMFAVYFIGGILNMLLSLRYRIPFGGAHSITVVAFLSAGAVTMPLSEFAGSFIMGGVLIALLGISGLFQKLLDMIPKPLIDAMLAGLILNYVVGIVPAMKEIPVAGACAVAGFFLTARMFKTIPPIFGVLALGGLGLWMTAGLSPMPAAEFVIPQAVVPSFTLQGFLSVTVPCTVLILSNDVAVGLAALKKNGFEPPVNRTLVASGLTTAAAGFFGGHATNIGGMMSALCSSEEAGPKDKRYIAGVVSGILVAVFGILAWVLVGVIQSFPLSFIQLVTGFSLVGVLLNSLTASYAGSEYRYSALFSFIIAISNVTFLGVSAALWSLIAGTITARILGEGTSQREPQKQP